MSWEIQPISGQSCHPRVAVHHPGTIGRAGVKHSGASVHASGSTPYPQGAPAGQCPPPGGIGQSSVAHGLNILGHPVHEGGATPPPPKCRWRTGNNREHERAELIGPRWIPKSPIRHAAGCARRMGGDHAPGRQPSRRRGPYAATTPRRAPPPLRPPRSDPRIEPCRRNAQRSRPGRRLRPDARHPRCNEANGKRSTTLLDARLTHPYLEPEPDIASRNFLDGACRAGLSHAVLERDPRLLWG